MKTKKIKNKRRHRWKKKTYISSIFSRCFFFKFCKKSFWSLRKSSARSTFKIAAANISLSSESTLLLHLFFLFFFLFLFCTCFFFFLPDYWPFFERVGAPFSPFTLARPRNQSRDLRVHDFPLVRVADLGKLQQPRYRFSFTGHDANILIAPQTKEAPFHKLFLYLYKYFPFSLPPTPFFTGFSFSPRIRISRSLRNPGHRSTFESNAALALLALVCTCENVPSYTCGWI